MKRKEEEMIMKQTRDYYYRKIKWLKQMGFKELSPVEYYRLMFPVGSFQKEGERQGDYQPNGILMFRSPWHEKKSMTSALILDDLKAIQDCIARKGIFQDQEFVLISGCSYIGKRKANENARCCHAVIIDVDEVDVNNLQHLIGMAAEDIIPMPTAISVSGNGVHVVYVLEQPIPLYRQKFEMLTNLKMLLTRKIWNEKTSKDANVQYQGLVQGYRAVGTRTKKGHVVKAFQTGRPVSVETLIGTIREMEAVTFLPQRKELANGKIDKRIYTQRIEECLKDRKLTEKMLEELSPDHESMAALKQEAPDWFPDWYQRRVIEKQKAGHLNIGRTPYDKWLNTIKQQARQGNRKMCLYCLAAFAQKCDIGQEEFVRDANSLLEPFNALTVDKSNPFTQADVDWVIDQFNNADLVKMSLNKMERITGVAYPKKEKSDSVGGRPNKEETVQQYLAEHPEERNVTRIAQYCNCSRPTVYKYLKNPA